MRILSLLSAIAVVAACSDDIVGANGVPSRSMSLKVGETLELTLQSIGPGEYASPPAISSALLRFLDVSLVTPAVPAGVTQKFRFSGQAAGRAVITLSKLARAPIQARGSRSKTQLRYTRNCASPGLAEQPPNKRMQLAALQV